jgi:hypothetical protein
LIPDEKSNSPLCPVEKYAQLQEELGNWGVAENCLFIAQAFLICFYTKLGGVLSYFYSGHVVKSVAGETL